MDKLHFIKITPNQSGKAKRISFWFPLRWDIFQMCSFPMRRRISSQTFHIWIFKICRLLERTSNLKAKLYDACAMFVMLIFPNRSNFNGFHIFIYFFCHLVTNIGKHQGIKYNQTWDKFEYIQTMFGCEMYDQAKRIKRKRRKTYQTKETKISNVKPLFRIMTCSLWMVNTEI